MFLGKFKQAEYEVRELIVRIMVQVQDRPVVFVEEDVVFPIIAM